jgi:hypothetical protein
MLTYWRALALLFLVALPGCAGVHIEPCDDRPSQAAGPCSVGAHHENSV